MINDVVDTAVKGQRFFLLGIKCPIGAAVPVSQKSETSSGGAVVKMSEPCFTADLFVIHFAEM